MKIILTRFDLNEIIFNKFNNIGKLPDPCSLKYIQHINELDHSMVFDGVEILYDEESKKVETN